MAIETEIKLRLADAADFVRRLASLRPVMTRPRHFEDNFILDFADSQISAQHSLIRVRITDTACYLTYKGPPRADGPFKSREELETRIDDGRAMLRILERLGLRVGFRYQKYRSEYELHSESCPENRILVAIDETPIGVFVEFEGSEEGIREMAGAMGFRESQYIRDSYYALYYRHCLERCEPATHMIFSANPRAEDGCGVEDGR